MDKKRDELEALNNLQHDINQMAARLAAGQKKTAQKLRGAGSMIQDERLADNIRQGAWLEQRGLWPMAYPQEEELSGGMDQLAERLKDAQSSLAAEGDGDKLQEALNLAERVRRGLEEL